jgi:DNA repair exonuclease SbcCD ATPase subunit
VSKLRDALEELRTQRAKLDRMITESTDEADLAQASAEILRKQLGQYEQQISRCQQDLKRIDHDQCPYCGQPVPPRLIDEARLSVENAKTTFFETRAKVGDELTNLDQEYESLLDESRALRKRRETVVVQLTRAATTLEAADAVAKEEADFERRLAAKRTQVSTVQEAARKAAEVVDGLEAEEAELRAVETVLGTEGVRAHLLSEALGALETTANFWLSRLAPVGISVALKPYAEQKSGNVRDRISLEIEGAGGGNGYDGASTGEQRRIDIALLFALADLASGGEPRGTIFLDEVLDTLDPEGIELVSQALRELAADRAVMVVSHNEEAYDALKPDIHWTVENGHVDLAV